MGKRKKNKKALVSKKAQQGQQFNDFKSRLWKMACACGIHHGLALIPKTELQLMYMFRTKPFRLDLKAGTQINSATFKVIKRIVNHYLMGVKTTLMENGPEISIYEYCYIGESLRLYVSTLREIDFNGAKEVKEAFAPFLKSLVDHDVPFRLLFDAASAISWTISAIDKGFYLLNLDRVNKKGVPPLQYICYQLEFIAPQKLQISPNGNPRPIYRIGWTSTAQEMKWASINPAALNLPTHEKDHKMAVYAQKHALMRINERLDCFDLKTQFYFLFHCFENLRMVTNSRGQQLIEFYLLHIKVGYLRFEYINGVVAIKTFLLLTQGGTPEGDRLHALLGLDKIDTKYLGLDKISSFIASDIPDNPQLMQLFRDAGCADLFSLTTSVQSKNPKTMHNAELIEAYLELDKINEMEEQHV